MALMAVGSAGFAWYSAKDGQDRLRQIAARNLPALSATQALAKEASGFMVLAHRMSQVATKEERYALVLGLEKSIVTLHEILDRLQALGFSFQQTEDLRKQIVKLTINLDLQGELTHDFLEKQTQLGKTLHRLAAQHRKFINIAEPRIASGYRSFIERGNRVGNRIRDSLSEIGQGVDPGELRALDKEVRVGLGTLINMEVGEMRANLELVATTYLAVGLLHEAANVNDIPTVTGLEQRYQKIDQALKRFKLILGSSTPENRQVLVTSVPLIAFGKGLDSIFNQRREELWTRAKVSSLAQDSARLIRKFDEDLSTLVIEAREATIQASGRLQQDLERTRSIQVITALLAVFTAVLIGWFYVRRGIVKRLMNLRRVMEEQAAGREAPIPVGRADELGDMAGALKVFVDQRREAEEALKESEGRFRVLAEISPYPVVIGAAGGLVEYVSPRFTDLFGYPAREVVDQASLLANLFPGEKDPRPFPVPERSQDPARVFSQARDTEVERTATCKNSQRKRVVIHLTELPGGAFYLIIQDLTERLRVEEERLRGEKLRSAIETAGAVCHELNQPLQTISAKTELMLMRQPDQKTLSSNLEILLDEADRIAAITRRLQKITKYQTIDYADGMSILDLDESSG